MKTIMVSLLIGIPTFLFAKGASHTSEGCFYSPRMMEAYEKGMQGVDRLLFFNPYIIPFLEDGKEQAILDAGCGSGTWSVFAASAGCRVYAIDCQDELIDRAVENIGKGGMLGKVFICNESLSGFPYRNDLFDRSLSLMVVGKLPKSQFARHFREIARTLKKEGEAIVAAPASFGVVFSNESKSGEAVFEDIESVLGRLSDESTEEEIVNTLSELTSVLSATFAYQEGRLYLVTDESGLTSGQPIWRKVAKGALPSFYYSEADYLKQFEASGLALIEVVKPLFHSEEQMTMCNACHDDKLGSVYLKHPPFVFYHLQKQGKVRLVAQKKEPIVKRYWGG